MATNCDRCLDEHLQLLEEQLATVERFANANDLPEAIVTESGQKTLPWTRRYLSPLGWEHINLTGDYV